MDAEFAKLFTPEQANRMLPLVRRIVEDIRATYYRVLARHETFDRIQNSSGKFDQLHADELTDATRAMEAEADRLRDLIGELDELEVLFKGPKEGLVDFPCLIDGRVILLCWKLGEPEVAHWHEVDAGFAGRQPLESLLTTANPQTPNDA